MAQSWSQRQRGQLVVVATAVTVVLFVSFYLLTSSTLDTAWRFRSYASGIGLCSSGDSTRAGSLVNNKHTHVDTGIRYKLQTVESSSEVVFQGSSLGVDGNLYPPNFVPFIANQAPRMKAAFVVLVRNNEVDAMCHSIRSMEARFNHKYGYPWIFLNGEGFCYCYSCVSKSTPQLTFSSFFLLSSRGTVRRPLQRTGEEDDACRGTIWCTAHRTLVLSSLDLKGKGRCQSSKDGAAGYTLWWIRVLSSHDPIPIGLLLST
jgi:hypothetical protein